MANKYYFGSSTLFKLKLLSRRLKITLYKVLIRLDFALQVYETRATTKINEKKLGVLKKENIPENVQTKKE